MHPSELRPNLKFKMGSVNYADSLLNTGRLYPFLTKIMVASADLTNNFMEHQAK